MTMLRKADKCFSMYIRTLYATNGKVKCFTCGILLNVEHMQCGHYLPRGITATRFSDINCKPQCAICNISKQGNLEVFRQRLVEMYGEKAIQELEALKKKRFKLTDQYLKEVCESLT